MLDIAFIKSCSLICSNILISKYKTAFYEFQVSKFLNLPLEANISYVVFNNKS